MADTENCVFIDFETRSRRTIADGAFAYAADPSTDILCIAYSINDQPPVSATPDQKELLEPLFECISKGYNVVAHNMLFEIAIIKYVARPKYDWPSIKLSQFRCTLQMSGRACIPLDLAGAAKALKITNKLESGKALLKLFSIPQKDGRFIELDSRPREKERLLEYCKVDTVVSREIYMNLPEWKASEIEDILFDLKSNLNGVPVDVETSKMVYEEVLRQQAKFASKVTQLTNGVITKMTQAQRIKNWVKKNVNEDIPNCTADTVQEILDGEFGELDSVSQQILEMRVHSGKSSTGKYLRFVNSSIDGYIHGMVISFGARTGRAISKLLNLYNLPKPSVEYSTMDSLVYDLRNSKPDSIDEKYGSYLKCASTAIRGMIKAPKGKKLAVSDYASIEARLVFWLSSCNSGLIKYRDGIDLYKDAASRIFNVPYASVTDEQRWLGKQVILGAGFGLGAKGFVNSCLRWGVEVSLELAKTAIDAYREAYPEVVWMWESLESSAMLACKTGKITYACNGRIAFKTRRSVSGIIMLQMRLPSGRCINYPKVGIEKVVTPWGAKKKAVVYYKAGNGGFFKESTYGGKLCENAVQAIARDIMYYGAKEAQSSGFNILFTVYDEIIALVDEDKADIELFNELICRKPAWAAGVPLEAEGEMMERYRKL